MSVPALPALADEGHSCPSCGMSFARISVDQAIAYVRTVPASVREAILGGVELRARPDAATWSPLEYLCHLRDVYAAYTIRLHRTRTEDTPALEPMLNDLRAKRFRYNELDPAAVLAELAANVTGFCEEAALYEPGDWDRIATRLPGERRTARWLVRQAMHEGMHHLADILRQTA